MSLPCHYLKTSSDKLFYISVNQLFTTILYKKNYSFCFIQI